MRILILECPGGCPPILDEAFNGQSAIGGLLAAAPLSPARPGAILLFRSDDDLAEAVASDAWTRARLNDHRSAVYDAPAGVAIERPVFIIGAPRSGTTLLLELLAAAPAFWTVGGEALGIYDADPATRAPHPKPTHRQLAGDATPAIAAGVRAGFLAAARNRYRTLLVQHAGAQRPASIRILEKTPRNALRIPFVRAIFPDARFIYLYRRPEENVASLIEGWRSGRFVIWQEGSYRWSFLMPPGWRELVDRPIAEIAAFQWSAANACAVDDLAAVPREQWCAVSYAELVDNPRREVTRVCRFAGVAPGPALERRLARPLAASRSTLTPPAPDKWRVHADDIDRVRPVVEPVYERIRRCAAGNPSPVA
jgi:hypothetical protein